VRNGTRRPYSDTIREILARNGRIGVDPRHVEAHMRCEHGALDALSLPDFTAEVLTGAECALADPALSERLAGTYGL